VKASKNRKPNLAYTRLICKLVILKNWKTISFLKGFVSIFNVFGVSEPESTDHDLAQGYGTEHIWESLVLSGTESKDSTTLSGGKVNTAAAKC